MVSVDETNLPSLRYDMLNEILTSPYKGTLLFPGQILWVGSNEMRQQILIASLLLLISATAWADPAEVAQSCATGSDCTALVDQEIAGMQGSQADKDKAVADLVVSIATQSQTADRKSCENMAEAVKGTSRSVSDAGQQARILDIGNTMCTAQTQTAAIGDDSPGENDGGERNDDPASSN
jgi:hypothetical protein